MSFNELCSEIIGYEALKQDFTVTGLSSNSGTIKGGEIFMALSGTRQHGINFIEQAVARGASAVLFEQGSNIKIGQGDFRVPCYEVINLGMKLSGLAAKFYGCPSDNMQVTAVTGTNGKSSIVYTLKDAIADNLGKAAVIGTMGFGHSELYKATHTTPDAIELQKIISGFAGESVRYLLMEASSHGLAQGRLESVNVDTAVYTNLSRDHQDFHGSMTDYAKAKERLFATPEVRNALINVNDGLGVKLADKYGSTLRLVSYGVGIEHRGEYLSAENIRQDITGSQFVLHSSWGEFELETRLLGQFNIENILAIMGGFLLSGGDVGNLPSIVKNIKPLTGRMECLGGNGKPLIVVDYAHTPDALEQALKSLRKHVANVGKLYCVFGCGGDRDQGKRPLMAKVAQIYADYIVVTDDNPRTEDPRKIIDQIIKGVSDTSAVTVIGDRQQAIYAAVSSASKDDVVLIAGKGHETEQIVGNQKLHFSDQEEVRRAL